MKHKKKTEANYRALLISFSVSAVIFIIGFIIIGSITFDNVLARLLWPLIRLMFFVGIGLAAGQVIEASGWIKVLSYLAGPLFRFANLGNLCGAAFTAAFFSGVAANAMLLDFYKDGKISRRQLFLTNFINQMPAYFQHLPTTFFIVLPLAGWAGALYFIITFLAMAFRTFLLFIYGHIFLRADPGNKITDGKFLQKKDKPQGGVWAGIKSKFPGRITAIAIYVVPIYILVYLLNSGGFFSIVREWMAEYLVTSIIPVESLSVVILSFAAEFTSGFAAAGALMNAGVLTVKQTVLALLAGNIIAFPVRAVRHQLPRYIGIFSPKMGTSLLFAGQGLRVTSLVTVGMLYYYLC